MIQIIKNGNGPWPDYAETGTVVSVSCHGEALAIDCAARQTDARVTIDIVHGADGRLAEGVRSGGSYVASLEIPPARYKEPEAPKAAKPRKNEPDAMLEQESAPRERLPLTDADMVAVILHLWTIPDACQDTQEGE